MDERLQLDVHRMIVEGSGWWLSCRGGGGGEGLGCGFRGGWSSRLESITNVPGPEKKRGGSSERKELPSTEELKSCR